MSRLPKLLMNTVNHKLLACFAALALALPGVTVLGADTAPAAEAPRPVLPTDSPPLRIQVDPRVELMSLLFRLAGNPEYSQGKVQSYTADVERQFNAFRGHEVVKLAGQLRGTRGVSFDACMSLAVHLDNASELEFLVPLDPWPEGLDKRWTATEANRFLDAARRFVRDSAFSEFLKQHRSLYETTEDRMQALMKKEGHLEWFQEFFGERLQPLSRSRRLC